MTDNVLGKIFEHNNWANAQIIQVCINLTDEQLDAEPHSATRGSIRQTMQHLIGAQHNYLSLLTLPVAERQRISPELNEWQESARSSGEGLLALAKDPSSKHLQAALPTADGHQVEPWVVMVQVINHATEHREQICSMLSALGITPPDLDGWSYGDATDALKSTAG